MPIYAYKCLDGHETTRLVPIDQRNNLTPCPVCDKPASRVISPVPTNFKFADPSAQKR